MFDNDAHTAAASLIVLTARPIAKGIDPYVRLPHTPLRATSPNWSKGLSVAV